MDRKNYLRLRNGSGTPDLDFYLEVGGRIEGTDKGYRTIDVSDETKTIWFKGTIRKAYAKEGAGTAWVGPKNHLRRIAFKNLEGWDTREHPGGKSGSGNDNNNSTENNNRGNTSPPMNNRLNALDPDDEMEHKIAAATNSDYGDFFENIPVPHTGELGMAVADGEYTPGAIQRTLLCTEPHQEIDILGNRDNPYAVDLSRSNHNFINLMKDEHFAVKGMLWGRTQFAGAGDVYARDMAFTDRHGKGESALGGKRAAGRFINCDIGHKDDPDEYAAFYYGGGSVLFDRGNEFRARGDAYIGVNNHVTLYIGDNNEWLSGDKEVVEGSGIYPSDLDSDINIIEAGKLHDSGWL